MHVVIQKQKHTNQVNIVGKETQPWRIGDGMICHEKGVALIAYGADCSIISFSNKERIGVCHAGWRGFTQGIIKQMSSLFSGGVAFVGPFLHSFEIKKDECYKKIEAYAGTKYFSEENGKIIFDFRSAVLAELGGLAVHIDQRNTFSDPKLGSFRRDGKRGDGTQNRVVVWRCENGEAVSKVFLPSENIRDYFLRAGL